MIRTSGPKVKAKAITVQQTRQRAMFALNVIALSSTFLFTLLLLLGSGRLIGP